MAAKRNITTYSRLMILLAIFIVAAGFSTQSVQINLFTQDDIDARYANAMAQQMVQALATRLEDTRGLQKAASESPYTLNALIAGDDEWVKSLQTFLPGSVGIKLVDRMGTLGLFKDYGYAVQELVTRTLKGAEMRFEAVSIDGKLRFYWATPVRNENKDIVGVMLVEYGQAWLDQFQAVASQKLGRVIVNQYVENDKPRGVKVFDVGQSNTDISSAVTLPINDYWYLSYLPNNERPILGLFPLVAPWVGALALITLFLIALALLQKREVKRNQLMLLNYLRVLSRHGRAEEPPFTLAIFSDLATRMLQILRAHKRIDNSNAAAAQAVDIQLEPTRRAAIINRKAAPKEMGVMVEELDDDPTP